MVVSDRNRSSLLVISSKLHTRFFAAVGLRLKNVAPRWFVRLSVCTYDLLKIGKPFSGEVSCLPACRIGHLTVRLLVREL